MSAQDRDLLRLYGRHRSEAAFRELVVRYASLVYSTAFRHLQDRASAEDAAQEVFVRLAQSAAQLDDHVNLAGWLYRTARHVALNQARARQREARRVAESTRLPVGADDQEAWWERAAEAIDPALEALDDQEREVLFLRFYRGMKFREVGQATGLSEAAAKMRVGRSIDRLRGLLLSRGVECPGALLGSVLGSLWLGEIPDGMAAAFGNGSSGGGAAAPVRVYDSVATGWSLAGKPAAAVGLAALLLLGGAYLVHRGTSSPSATATASAANAPPMQASVGSPSGVDLPESEPPPVEGWSRDQLELWAALTAPLEAAPEPQREWGLYVVGNLSSAMPFSPQFVSKQLHLQRIRKALLPFEGAPGPALEVLREALRYQSVLVREECVQALALLGYESAPLLEQVLQMVADGDFEGMPPYMLAGCLPKLAEPRTLAERLLGLLRRGDLPTRLEVSSALGMVLFQTPALKEEQFDTFVELTRAEDLVVRATGLGLVAESCNTPALLARLNQEYPPLAALIPLTSILIREGLEGGVLRGSPAEEDQPTEDARFISTIRAQRVLLGLDQDPAGTSAALRELMSALNSAEERDRLVRALAAFDPNAASDPDVGERLAQLKAADRFRERAQAGNVPVEELLQGMQDAETVSAAADALARLGPPAKPYVSELVSQVGHGRDYYIFRALKEIEPAAVAACLRIPGSADEAAAALGDLGAAGAWALPALHEALSNSPPESARRIASAIESVEHPVGR